jgi:hypothetical protein
MRPALPFSRILRILLVVAALVIATLLALRFWPKGDSVNNGRNDENGNRSSGLILTNAVPQGKTVADADGDGLSDAEEATLGTDPKRVDSDNDGLYDYEEEKAYKTDPLNSDTDGDGFKDGEEVRRKFDPNGSGNLLELVNK